MQLVELAIEKFLGNLLEVSMATYKTLGMMKDAGMGKDVNGYMSGGVGVPYLLAADRKQYLIEVSPHGRLTQGGFLLNTLGTPQKLFIFVMDGDGKIYSANKSKVQHHSSFLAGGPAAAAGHWRVEYGALQYVCNQSGHYQPPFDYTQQILVELKKRGVDVSGVEADWSGMNTKNMVKVTTKKNIAFNRIGPQGVIASRF